jgi:tRNA pseudouridine38-40 synthase
MVPPNKANIADRAGAGSGNSRDDMKDRRADKRQKVIAEEANGKSFMSIPFSTEEIAAEERRPKRKVAVLIGYAGTGYHGLQINHMEKTIEGEIFSAFVKAGAISKANADDPKKSSLVRCARTDKGVHAAGNVLSLKLIIEDDNVVDKINEHLPPQIRVWGIQRTGNSFSAYQACESRWYEYLMPSYALLPPHPKSFIGKAVAESSKELGVTDECMDRLDDVKDFWDEVEKNEIQPILDELEPDVRAEVLHLLHGDADQALDDQGLPVKASADSSGGGQNDTQSAEAEAGAKGSEETADPNPENGTDKEASQLTKKPLSPAEVALKKIKSAYVKAKRSYRVSPTRLKRLQDALNMYVGTHNYHNYTVMKSAKDPSAQRHIKSFEVNPQPIPIRDTEWLSLKVHGQSFMMHQIRKMVAMAMMVVRCGAPLSLIKQSYEHRRISIPKAPSLGLMLERPMFAGYNSKAVGMDKEPIDFAKFDEQIQKFKDTEIYNRMFETEENENS